jgi:small subunit ribosomal protein S8
MSDVVGDMLTRIRNAQRVMKKNVNIPHSKEKESVLKVLQSEGYIRSYSVRENEKGLSDLVVELKYYEGISVIQSIVRRSKPGRRVYSSIKDLPLVSNGLGIYILSTSKGVMSDAEARRQNVGGEVICSVF